MYYVLTNYVLWMILDGMNSNFVSLIFWSHSKHFMFKYSLYIIAERYTERYTAITSLKCVKHFLVYLSKNPPFSLQNTGDVAKSARCRVNSRRLADQKTEVCSLSAPSLVYATLMLEDGVWNVVILGVSLIHFDNGCVSAMILMDRVKYLLHLSNIVDNRWLSIQSGTQVQIHYITLSISPQREVMFPS